MVKLKIKICQTRLITLLSIIVIVTACMVNAQLTNTVTIRNTGQISTTTVWAKSGYWRDIQDAVNQAATYGIANVYIPEGTFNFVNVGEPWMTVQVPAGVSIFGVPTERTSGLPYDGVGMNPNGQVVEWKTVLVMPYEAPDRVVFFQFEGTQDPNKPSRFSDIKLVGYREIDPNSTRMYGGVHICDILNFRVDHCYFRNLAHYGVSAEVGDYGYWGKKEYGRTYTCGVIDHCYFVNTHGEPRWEGRTVTYGVFVGRGSYNEDWEEDITKVAGQYTKYTVFIEDCYFEKWRHCVSSNHGAHYVFRHGTIQYDYGMSLDAHGWGYILDGRVLVGTRAIEVYNNKFLDPIGGGENPKSMPLIRGGAAFCFNNIVQGYLVWMLLSQEADDAVAKCQVHNVYEWNNTVSEGCKTYGYVFWGDKNPIVEGVDYFRDTNPTWYTPYPYPHPLTLKAP